MTKHPLFLPKLLRRLFNSFLFIIFNLSAYAQSDTLKNHKEIKREDKKQSYTNHRKPNAISVLGGFTLAHIENGKINIGMPLFGGFYYKIGNTPFYLGSYFNWHITRQSANSFQHKHTISYDVFNRHWLNLQSGIGLGFQSATANISSDLGSQITISSVHLGLNFLQARLLLSRHFFCFFNNELLINFTATKIDGQKFNKNNKVHYELSSGIGVSF